MSDSDLEAFRAETREWLEANCPPEMREPVRDEGDVYWGGRNACLLYTSPSPRDATLSRMPSSA